MSTLIPTSTMILATLAVVLGAAGTYLMLPHRHGLARPRVAHGAGLATAGVGFLFFLTFWGAPATFLGGLFLFAFGAAAVGGGLLTITSRDPVHSALWFASVVLATAGMFLLAGAPFLAAGTIIVYAGAIIVTFLFVIMLAQMEGRAVYDRAARAPEAATITCYLLLWSLIVALSTVHTSAQSASEQPPTLAQSDSDPEKALPRIRNVAAKRGETDPSVALVLDRVLTPTSQSYAPAEEHDAPDEAANADAPAAPVTGPVLLQKPNVAGLGGSLYSDHLITVGLAGALLFVALVGAVAIVGPRRPSGEAAPAGPA